MNKIGKLIFCDILAKLLAELLLCFCC